VSSSAARGGKENGNFCRVARRYCRLLSPVDSQEVFFGDDTVVVLRSANPFIFSGLGLATSLSHNVSSGVLLSPVSHR